MIKCKEQIVQKNIKFLIKQMKHVKHLSMTIYVVVSLIVILVMGYYLYKKRHCEGYKKCICSKVASRECQDIDLVEDLYNKNLLTEYTKSPNKPKWSTVSPGDYDFPESVNCLWKDCTENKKWGKFDFTEMVG
jgi:hypothetical protein